MTIAVLALQGAFLEHEQMLSRIGADWFEVREATDWTRPKDGLILPGGESTTQGKLLRDLGLLEAMRSDILKGLPVFGTCAGLILMAREVEGQSTSTADHPSLATMDITACRNAYGRQLGSFFTEAEMKGIGKIPMTFIRAPYIKEVRGSAEPLATVDGRIVAAREGNQLATAFHPELNDDTRVHRYFLDSMVGSR